MKSEREEKIIQEQEEKIFGGVYALKRALIESACNSDLTPENMEFYDWLIQEGLGLSNF